MGDLAYQLPANDQALLRREALQWALSTSSPGERLGAILERAEAYAAFVMKPLRDDQGALRERAANRLH